MMVIAEDGSASVWLDGTACDPVLVIASKLSTLLFHLPESRAGLERY